MKKRCLWPGDNTLMVRYHDKEWGVPCHTDRILYEFLLLDAFQAGLSWAIILNKRDNFRRAFSNFNPRLVAKYDNKKIKELLQNEGIVRNKLKIGATIENAQHFLKVQIEFGSFDAYVWQFVVGMQKQNKWKTLKQIPATSKESDALSYDLKKRGFRFVGSTTIYAFMQAAGLVNDHVVGCFRYKEISVQ